MFGSRFILASLILFAGIDASAASSEISASRIAPNLVDNIARPLRYRPDHGDFVIQNGSEFFNRPLYGGNTAFRVDGGDKPEFVLYLPGRGGNLRLGIRTPGGEKWLSSAGSIETRYRPGELIYEVRDPLLGRDGVLRVAAVAYAATEGLGVKVIAQNVASGTELLWAYGGANGQRGKRDGDIGTEKVPISQWFQLQPRFCGGNRFSLSADGFVLRAKAATIVGVVPTGSKLAVADAEQWNDLRALFGATAGNPEPPLPVVVGSVTLANNSPAYVSLQRVAPRRHGGGTPPAADLDIYREVTAAPSPGSGGRKPLGAPPPSFPLAAPFTVTEVPAQFAAAERHFAQLRERVAVDTPDPFLNAAVGALNVAAEAVWDGPQQGIMHGAIAWRTRLLGWRGPYVLDALGWHDRFRRNALYWFARQNTAPIPTQVPPPDEKSNLARNEAGLHTNGDLSNSHYDMNLVFIDAVFRHLQWTGDLAFARQAWPVIQRHLAWERRLFRREYGPQKLPLYEAYAAIWASDDLQYDGGGAMHATAYNYYENRQAARLARILGKDPTPYEREADLLAKSMRALLWVTPAVDSQRSVATAERDTLPVALTGYGDPVLHQHPPFGWFAEYKDWLGLQRVHPDAALWTFYHTVDSEVPTPQEAWQMAEYVDAEIPHIPVRGPGVPPALCTLATSDWMPYDWSINNVVMAEAVHGALALWEAGRPHEAWAVTKGSVLAAMFMGISPGNVGSMSYLDVYRRESQRDFADGAGVLSRALVEGLFGVKPDALAGEIRVAPGWPATWDHAQIRHPDFALSFHRSGEADTYELDERLGGPGSPGFPRALALRLIVDAPRDRVAAVTVNGKPAGWHAVDDSVGRPRIEIGAPAAARYVVVIRWAGAPVHAPAVRVVSGRFEQVRAGQMHWWMPERDAASTSAAPEAGDLSAADGDRAIPGLDYTAIGLSGARFKPVDLSRTLNARVTQIFRNQYRSPRSPFVSLALPQQGIGGWAGGVNRTAEIDDTGLRAAAAQHGGEIIVPGGIPFSTPVAAAAANVAFVSQWDNYPRELAVPLTGHARGVYLLMAGSTDPMQSRFENGDVVVRYTDGSTARLDLVNPTNWWPIDQDYFIDDFQFRRPGPLPIRVDLKTGRIRQLEMPEFKGRGGTVPGGAATVLALPLDPNKTLQSLQVEATANDVVIGLMAATLVQ